MTATLLLVIAAFIALHVTYHVARADGGLEAYAMLILTFMLASLLGSAVQSHGSAWQTAWIATFLLYGFLMRLYHSWRCQVRAHPEYVTFISWQTTRSSILAQQQAEYKAEHDGVYATPDQLEPLPEELQTYPSRELLLQMIGTSFGKAVNPLARF